MRRAVLLILLLAMAVAAGGCAGQGSDNAGDFRGEQRAVAQAVDDISKHAFKLESRQICDGFMTPELKAKLGAEAKRLRRGADCADGLKDSLEETGAFDPDISKIEITGKRAVVTMSFDTKADPDPVGTLRMVNQRGWRISELP